MGPRIKARQQDKLRASTNAAQSCFVLVKVSNVRSSAFHVLQGQMDSMGHRHLNRCLDMLWKLASNACAKLKHRSLWANAKWSSQNDCKGMSLALRIVILDEVVLAKFQKIQKVEELSAIPMSRDAETALRLCSDVCTEEYGHRSTCSANGPLVHFLQPLHFFCSRNCCLCAVHQSVKELRHAKKQREKELKPKTQTNKQHGNFAEGPFHAVLRPPEFPPWASTVFGGQTVACFPGGCKPLLLLLQFARGRPDLHPGCHMNILSNGWQHWGNNALAICW